MALTFTLEELSSRIGETVPTLEAWQRLGLMGGGPFDVRDLERSRLFQFLMRQGVSAERIAESSDAPASVERYLASVLPSGAGDVCTIEQAIERTRLPQPMLERLADAVGVGSGGLFTAADVSMLGWWGRAIAAGMPEEAVVQLVRVYRESLGRVAEAEVRLFHFYVHEALRATGLNATALREATKERSAKLLPMIAPALAYFHRLGFARAEREDMLLHLAGDDRPLLEVPGQLAAGVVFVDLSSFTPLTDAMGDAEAAAILARFAELVHQVTERHAGRSAKQIGDGFMLMFFEPQAAVAAALEIVTRVGDEISLAACAGVHWGHVVYREGDYYGGAVNLSARLVDAAERHQVVITSAVREQVGDLQAVEFLSLGSRILKGVLEPQELFEARRIGPSRATRLRDLVCGMELARSDVAVRLELEGAERVFCSETCLRQFVAAPARYLAGG